MKRTRIEPKPTVRRSGRPGIESVAEARARLREERRNRLHAVLVALARSRARHGH